jgi:hypothetical protein
VIRTALPPGTVRLSPRAPPARATAASSESPSARLAALISTSQIPGAAAAWILAASLADHPESGTAGS